MYDEVKEMDAMGEANALAPARAANPKFLVKIKSLHEYYQEG
jgi:hypothetical protein